MHLRLPNSNCFLQPVYRGQFNRDLTAKVLLVSMPTATEHAF